MRQRAAHDRGVEQAGPRQIVDIGAGAAQEAPILAPLDRAADESVALGPVVHPVLRNAIFSKKINLIAVKLGTRRPTTIVIADDDRRGGKIPRPLRCCPANSAPTRSSPGERVQFTSRRSNDAGQIIRWRRITADGIIQASAEQLGGPRWRQFKTSPCVRSSRTTSAPRGVACFRCAMGLRTSRRPSNRCCSDSSTCLSCSSPWWRRPWRSGSS